MSLPNRYLRRVALALPPEYHPLLKSVYKRFNVRVQAIRTQRGLHSAPRIMFVAPEIADLETYEFLSPGLHEVLVDVAYNAVSVGTELAQLTGAMPKGFPYSPGYSGAGIVTAVGRGVSGIAVGSLVAGQFKHARRLVVHESKVFSLPPQVDLKEAAFIEIGIIVLQAVRKAMIQLGETVVVLGQGIIGQMASRLARNAGAAPVIASALSSQRRLVALAEGAADMFIQPDALEENAADVVIESAGAPGAFSAALRVARPGGRVILLGSSRGVERAVPLQEHVQTKSLRLIGAHVSIMPREDSSTGMRTYRQEGHVFVELLEARKLNVNSLITHVVSAAEINTLLESLIHGDLSPVGLLLDWKDVK